MVFAKERLKYIMPIIFRVDASIQIGTGHVMRCLTLANALKKEDKQCFFICRQHQGHLIPLIEDSGYKVLALPIPSKVWLPSSSDQLLHHAKWLGVDMLDDAEQTLKLLDSENIQTIDYLILDHYALDKHWENKLKPYSKNIMVIDDLADRQHSCDLLLDQTFARSKEDYKKLVPEKCTILAGSQYALLRPEFAKWREYSLKRRVKPEFKKLLIAMGGVDPDNYTGKILEELSSCELPKDLTITVILGKTAPHLDRVKVLALSIPLSINVKTGVNNMAEIMANNDIAIGAAGATTWERCCLGLPTIQVVIAKNQKLISKSLSIRGVISCLVDLTELSVKLEDVKKNYSKMFLSSLSISDGNGSKRVFQKLGMSGNSLNDIVFDPVSMEDRDYIFSLQNRSSRKYFKIKDVPTLSEHNLWFNKIMKSHDALIFVVSKKGIRIGMVRLDDISKEKTNEISIIIDSCYSGKGIGKNVVLQVLNIFNPKNLLAFIHKDNISSIKIFKKQGFILKKSNDVFLKYIYND